MAFGRRKRDKDTDDHASVESVVEEPAATDADSDAPDGPFDIEDFDNPEDATIARLDLGSVLVPIPPTGQLQG